MDILITGTNGFLAREMYNYFSSQNHNVVCVSPSAPYFIDLTDKSLTNNFFKNRYFDIVLHTSIVGAKKEFRNSPKTLIDNLLMFNNILQNKDKYNLLFNFCSGAALVQSEAEGCYLAKEEDIINCIPKNYYGLSKNVIARQILELDNVYNLRLFGCFGKYENNDRFIKSSLLKIKNNSKPTINANREMDFFYVEDVYKVLEFIILFHNTKIVPKDINLVYKEKLTLIQLLKLIFHLTNTKEDFILEQSKIESPYTGSSERLDKLNLPLNGLEFGLNEVLKNVF